MRLIDADALFEVIKKSMAENPHKEETQRAMHIHEHKYFLTLLAGIPTIQPEPPIIKCKDCKWWRKQKDSAQGRCRLLGIYPTGAWYCGNAERRTE